MIEVAKYCWEKRGAFALPWMIAYRVPIEKVEADKMVKKEGRVMSFKGAIGLNILGICELLYLFSNGGFRGFSFCFLSFPFLASSLGPEYVWRGPWPDGRDRFRPRADGTPGVPIEHVYPPAPRL